MKSSLAPQFSALGPARPSSLRRRIWYPKLTSCLKFFGVFPKVREAFPLAAPTLPRALRRVLITLP
jgi:hypothetical protein